MSNFQESKKIVRNYYQALSEADENSVGDIIRRYTADEYDWYGVHPFNKQDNREDVIKVFWEPLYKSWTRMQRREDIFIAGANERDGSEWTISMGHLMGVRDSHWLGIPPVRGMSFLRYADFNCVKNATLIRGAFFCDIVDVMQQAGLHALPMQTGSSFLYPGPRTHDGLLFDEQDPLETEKTLQVLNTMINDLSELNSSGNDRCSTELLEKTWNNDMIWYGPTGIGAFYTIPLYQIGHQYPFRENLKNKIFNGHVCRLAEGSYAGFFGWPNLSNTPSGNFLGMPATDKQIDMRVVDIYRREGDKLSENWVIIDIPHWLKQQGLDILERCNTIHNQI